jgi:NDP-sugar pyrophosphorylase family protein
MQAVILAGGLATRLRPLTEHIPKSLIEIDAKPFVEYQLSSLREGGVTDVVICVGYLGEQIEESVGDGSRLGVNVAYSYERGQLLGTAGALKNAETLLEDKFFIMYGDVYLFLDFDKIMSRLDKFDKLGLMVVYKNDDRWDRSNVETDGNFVKRYSKTDKTEGMVYIDYGASVLRKTALELVPPGRVYSLEELFPQMIERGELLAYEVTRRFFEVGSPGGLEEFKRYVSGS